MSHVTYHQPTDIVVVVPRGALLAVGLVFLLLGLTASLSLLFAGLFIQGIFLSLLVMVLVPFNLLILYILWRFYWYILIFAGLTQGLLACFFLTGIVSIGGSNSSPVRSIYSLLDDKPVNTPMPQSAIGSEIILYVVLGFVLALLVTVGVGGLIYVLMKRHSKDDPAPDRVMGTPYYTSHSDDQDYPRRAAAYIEQGMPTIKANVDKETLILYRAGVPWGVAWAIPRGSARIIADLVKWRDDAKVGTAILICPAFDADVKAAARANGVKLITLA